MFSAISLKFTQITEQLPVIENKKIAVCTLLFAAVFSAGAVGTFLTTSSWSIKLASVGVFALGGLIAFIASRSFQNQQTTENIQPKKTPEERFHNAYGQIKQEGITEALFKEVEKLADEEGYPEAQYNMGDCYDVGARGKTFSIAQDKIKAGLYYKKAANGGHTEAQFLLATWYLFGKPDFQITKNLYRAYKYCKPAADKNYAPTYSTDTAKDRLGVIETQLNRQKKRDEEDYNESLKLTDEDARFNELKRLADQGNPKAQLQVATNCFESTNSDKSLAFHYCNLAIQNATDNEEAAKRLFVEMCKKGHGTPLDNLVAGEYTFNFEK